MEVPVRCAPCSTCMYARGCAALWRAALEEPDDPPSWLALRSSEGGWMETEQGEKRTSGERMREIMRRRKRHGTARRPAKSAPVLNSAASTHVLVLYLQRCNVWRPMVPSASINLTGLLTGNPMHRIFFPLLFISPSCFFGPLSLSNVTREANPSHTLPKIRAGRFLHMRVEREGGARRGGQWSTSQPLHVHAGKEGC